jgi:2-haloacid dehalogenase
MTYGCGAYRPYQQLVQEAGADVGLPASCAETLQVRWEELTTWPEVPAVLGRLAARLPLGIVTNCSERLGRMAAACAGNAFKVVITAERAGYYKPRPEPYRVLLEKLGTRPERTLFVAGSASDVPGARGVGMPVFWHNRFGLPPCDGARPEFCEPSLARLPQIVLGED